MDGGSGQKKKDEASGGRAAVPGWQYVDVISGEGGDTHWKCKFCRKEFTSGGSRVQGHFLGRTSCGNKGNRGISVCVGGGPFMTAEFTKAKEVLGAWQRASNKSRDMKQQAKDLEKKVKDGDEVFASSAGRAASGGVQPEAGQPVTGGASSKKQQPAKVLVQASVAGSACSGLTLAAGALAHPAPSATGQLGSHKGKRKSADAELDEAIADFCYGEGVAFHKLESPFFHEVIKKAKKASEHYEPPSSFRLGSKLLDQKVHVCACAMI